MEARILAALAGEHVTDGDTPRQGMLLISYVGDQFSMGGCVSKTFRREVHEHTVTVLKYLFISEKILYTQYRWFGIFMVRQGIRAKHLQKVYVSIDDVHPIGKYVNAGYHLRRAGPAAEMWRCWQHAVATHSTSKRKGMFGILLFVRRSSNLPW